MFGVIMKWMSVLGVTGGLCLVSLGMLASEPVALLRIGGKPISKEAFGYYCRTRMPERDSLSVERCFRSFLSCQLKVADAEREGWDTLPEFRQRCKVIQGVALRSFFVDGQREEALSRQIYSRSQERLRSKGWVRTEEIVIPLSPCASNAEVEGVRVRLDSIYRSLRQGASFQSCAGVHAASAGWVPVVTLLREVAGQVENLKKGELSLPFFSPEGGHIVRLVDSRLELSYEEDRPYIRNYLERTGRDCPIWREEVRAQWMEGTLCSRKDVRVLLDAVRDSLLVACWDSSHTGTDSARPSPEELEAFFKSNRKDYDWEFPHYKGAVIQCRDKKMASRIRKRLRKLPSGLWKNALARLMEEDTTARARIEVGLFQIGTNSYVDKLAFRCGELPYDSDFPYSFVIGKRLKKGPECYLDVLDAVRRDYCAEREVQEMKALEQRLGVEINQEVLKSVNSNGSN